MNKEVQDFIDSVNRKKEKERQQQKTLFTVIGVVAGLFFAFTIGINILTYIASPKSSSSQVATNSNIEDCSGAELNDLSIGANKGIKFCNCKKTKSNSFSNVYMFAAQIKGKGINDVHVGVWAKGGNVRGFFTVDGYASEFSDWGDGGKTDANFSLSNDGAKEVRDYVKNMPPCN